MATTPRSIFLLLLGATAIAGQVNSIIPLSSESFTCPHDFGFYPHTSACDKYWACEGGAATLKVCGNGLSFDDTDVDFLTENCDYMQNVDCTGRPDRALSQDYEYYYEEFVCPKDNGFFPHEFQCDAYWKCEDGLPYFRLCGNGLAFDDTDDSREHCNYKFSVECGNRTEFEPAVPNGNCQYLFGIFPDPVDCQVFWSCWDGESSKYQCGPGLAYDRNSRICTWMDRIPECKIQRDELNQGLVCPASGSLTAKGSFTRHSHPDDCRQYYVCFDEVPREYGCPIGTVFQIGDQEGSGQCADPKVVPGCEDYYGDLDLESIKLSQQLLGAGGSAGRRPSSGPGNGGPNPNKSRRVVAAVETPSQSADVFV